VPSLAPGLALPRVRQSWHIQGCQSGPRGRTPPLGREKQTLSKCMVGLQAVQGRVAHSSAKGAPGGAPSCAHVGSVHS
jgi:hypothetical protein